MGVCCAVHGCFSSINDKQKRKFYRFPLDESRCRLWIRAAGRADLESKDVKALHNSYRICDLHFLSTDHFKRNLVHNAVPSLNLPGQEKNDKLSKHTQTDAVESNTFDTKIITPSTSKPNSDQGLSDNTPKKRKLYKKQTYNSKRIKMLELEDQLKISVDDEPEPIVQKIIQVQNYCKHNYRGNRYDHKYKMFAMNIYFASPLAYRILAKTLCLPSEKILKRTNIDIGTSYSENVIRCLQSKVKILSESEKICILCAGAMSLKRHLYYQINKDQIIGFHEINGIQKKESASQAFVVMARGLLSKWKQPLAYCFLSPNKNYLDLIAWLDNLIMKVFDIGFNVVAFTSNQGSDFINIARIRKVTATEPFFYVNCRKINYIFDVPHLLKSFRNILLTCDFKYHNNFDQQEQTASWEDVHNLYDMEKEKTYQIAYKLTQSHIKPNNFEKCEVKFAAQVFSRCVTAAIQCNVEFGKLPKKALGTAKLIQLINDMFDVLNSSPCNEKFKYKKKFSQQEMEVLQEVLFFLKNVRVVNKSNGKNVTNSLKCLKSLEITIQSVIQLSNDLKSLNFNLIYTRRLNQDVLKTLFNTIRQKGRNCRHPTPHQFAAAFRKLFLTNIIKDSEFANCPEGLDQLLVAIKDSINTVHVPENGIEDLNTLTVGTVDYRFELPEGNAFSYLCSYLLKKCQEVHITCKRMDEYVYYRGHNNFNDYVKQLDEIITSIFEGTDKLPLHVGTEILKNMEQITLTNIPCECFPLIYLKKLYIRFRIFNIIKQINRNFRDESFINKLISVSHL